MIFDLKKIVQDNNYNYSITNIKIKNFRVDEKNYETFEQISLGGILTLEVMFESLNKEILVEIKNFFSNLEIDIKKYFSTNYLELDTFNEKMALLFPESTFPFLGFAFPCTQTQHLSSTFFQEHR